MLEMLESKAATMGVCDGLWMYEFSGYFHNVVTGVQGRQGYREPRGVHVVHAGVAALPAAEGLEHGA